MAFLTRLDMSVDSTTVRNNTRKVKMEEKVVLHFANDMLINFPIYYQEVINIAVS